MPFSVCMCVYGKDNPAWFKQAVDSILHQTVAPDEVVLVVDGPVPGELNEVIRSYECLENFRVIRFAENRGHGNARRASLEHASHELAALMDADDISVPDRFEKQLAAFASKPDVSIVGGQISEFVGELTNVAGIREVFPTDEEIREDMRKRCPMNQVTVMFRRSDVGLAGGYIDWFCEEDYYLWLRMMLAGMKFANVPDVLVNVRVGEDMYRRRGGWKYFLSEFRLQNYMLKKKVIGPVTWAVNSAKRLIVQVLLPNRLRSFVFRKFARK